MAKPKDLNAAIKELEKNYTKVLKEAVQYATEEAETDINTKALLCLDEYYANYDPSSYDRTYSLNKAFVPYMNIKSSGTHLISTVGIMYDAVKLDGFYRSGSEKYGAKKKNGRIIEYGQPDSSWIIDLYLDGIHPTTDGSSIAGMVTYIPIVDLVSPSQKMDEYLDNYGKTFENNVYAYLVAHIMK